VEQTQHARRALLRCDAQPDPRGFSSADQLRRQEVCSSAFNTPIRGPRPAVEASRAAPAARLATRGLRCRCQLARRRSTLHRRSAWVAAHAAERVQDARRRLKDSSVRWPMNASTVRDFAAAPKPLRASRHVYAGATLRAVPREHARRARTPGAPQTPAGRSVGP
jgi:hypothetical protein